MIADFVKFVHMKNNTCQAIVKEWTKFFLNWMLIVQVLWELLQQGSDEDAEDKRGQGTHSASAGGRRSHCKFTSLLSPCNHIGCGHIFPIILRFIKRHLTFQSYHQRSYVSDYSQIYEETLAKSAEEFGPLSNQVSLVRVTLVDQPTDQRQIR